MELGNLRGVHRTDINRTLDQCCALVGHSLLRLWVMGDDSMTRAATEDELDAICELLETCLHHGAIGLSTSFVDMDEQLQPVPSRYADTKELDRLCAVLGQHGKILQVVHEFLITISH